MSNSEFLPDEVLLAALGGMVERASAGKLDLVTLRRVVTATVAMFARTCEQAGYELTPVGPDVNTTDAVRLSVALARSQHLTPFDLSLWFARRGEVVDNHDAH